MEGVDERSVMMQGIVQNLAVTCLQAKSEFTRAVRVAR